MMLTITAAQARERIMATLNTGPEDSSEGATAAFAMAARVAEDHVPWPYEDAAAWCMRVRGLLYDKLREHAAQLSPEAVTAWRRSWIHALAVLGTVPKR